MYQRKIFEYQAINNNLSSVICDIDFSPLFPLITLKLKFKQSLSNIIKANDFCGIVIGIVLKPNGASHKTLG